MTEALSIKNVSFSYGGPLVLENIDLTLETKEFIGLVGPNGSGKSTLLKLIMGLLKPDQGDIRIFGEAPETGCTRIGYMPQITDFARDFPISVEETVLLGRLGKASPFGFYGKRDHEITRSVMAEVSIDDLRKRPIGALSGGQFQRVLVARALAGEPDILILDEPTSNIDMRSELDIFELLSQLNERVTIIVVSHDIGFISKYIERVACLNRTLMVHKTTEITPELLQNLHDQPVHMVAHKHEPFE